MTSRENYMNLFLKQIYILTKIILDVRDVVTPTPFFSFWIYRLYDRFNTRNGTTWHIFLLKYLLKKKNGLQSQVILRWKFFENSCPANAKWRRTTSPGTMTWLLLLPYFYLYLFYLNPSFTHFLTCSSILHLPPCL